MSTRPRGAPIEFDGPAAAFNDPNTPPIEAQGPAAAFAAAQQSLGTPGGCATGGGAPPGSSQSSQPSGGNAPSSGGGLQTFDADPDQAGGRVTQTLGNLRNQPLNSGLGQQLSSALEGTGIDFHVYSPGQLPGQGTSTSNHDHGLAGDGYFYRRTSGGGIQKLSSTSAADRAVLNNTVLPNLVANGITQFGHHPSYMGTENWHLGTGDSAVRMWGDYSQSTLRGDNGWWVNSVNDAAIENGVPLSGASQTAVAANGGNPQTGGTPGEQFAGNNAAGGNQDPCAPYGGAGGSGCRPISAASPGAVASIAQGAGMDINGVMNQALGAVGGTGLGGIQQALQSGPLLDIVGTSDVGGAIGGALGANVASLGALPSGLGGFPALNTNGLSAVLNNVSSVGLDAVANVGSSILPGLTGVIPQGLTSVLGGGNLTGMIENVAGGVLQNGVPGLGNLQSVLGSAIGASGQGANLIGSIQGAGEMIFGNALESIGSLTEFPGFDLIPEVFPDGDIGFGDLIGDNDFGGANDNLVKMIDNLKSSVNLIGNPGEVLGGLIEGSVNGNTIDSFSSAFFDYQSFATQGLGNLTDDLRLLGQDMINLGSLGDMQDVLNIGTARQITRNLIEGGLGNDSGIIKEMTDRGLSLADTFQVAQEPLFLEVLDAITNPQVLQDVKTRMNMSTTLPLDSLGDLTRPSKALPDSDEYNRFDNINHIAITLLLCSSTGTGLLETFSDFGRMLFNMESVNMHSELMEEVAPVRPEELLQIFNDIPVKSKFNPNGPTVADFIGTAGGYVHDYTLPKMAGIMDELANYNELDTYRGLMQTLTNTLNGDYTDQIYEEIVVPGIGTYTTMDDAVLAVVNAIEAELTGIRSSIGAGLTDFAELLMALESHHYTSAEYLHHEKLMRSAYGVDIGENTAAERLYGDGSTTVFFPNEVGRNFQVFLNGAKTTDYTLSTTSVTFNTAPGSGVLIEFLYERDTFVAPSRKADSWNIANSLEDWATQVGHGGPADFLRRLLTDDRHGQRLDALMKQARNKERLAIWGLGCPGYNRVLNEGGDDTNINFPERTGIWTDDLQRASEIWLEDITNKPFESYLSDKLKDFNGFVGDDLSGISQGHLRQLIFLKDESIVITDRMAELYNKVKDTYRIEATEDMKLPYSRDFSDTGYVLGEYSEIISEIMDAENIVTEFFEVEMGDDAQQYLNSIGIDIPTLTGIIQRTLLYNRSQMLGITETEARNLFGMPSLSKLLLLNISQGF